MKWKGETEDQRWDRLLEWRYGFAWVPLKMDDGTWVWFESYEKREVQMCAPNHYRGGTYTARRVLRERMIP